MALSQKEIAELKREQTELETKRAELKEKCKNHRSMSVEDLTEATENLRKVSSRLDEISDSLKDVPNDQTKRGGLFMLKDFNGKDITEENFRSSAKYRDAFFRSFLHNKVAEADSEVMAFGKRAVTDVNGDGVASGGEYLVPLTTLNKVYTIIKQYGRLYTAITKFGFTGDVALPIGTAGNPTTNDEGITELNFSFTEVKISQMAVVATIPVKNLLLRNSIPAFEQYLSYEIGKYIGLLLENYVLNGSTTNSTFEGIVTAIKAASAAKTYSVLDWKGIAGIMGAVESPYGDNATWVMKRSTFFNRFFALTDNTGKPIVTITPLIQGKPGEDNYGSASPYLIAGQPVIFTSQMPDTEGILYGDLSTYVVNESESFVIESNTSEKFSEDKTVWRGKVYSGGKPLFAKDTFTYHSYSAT